MTKLEILAKKEVDKIFSDPFCSFQVGFKKAFKVINEVLDEESKLLEHYPFMGERIMTLKIYQKRINDLLAEMEKENEY